MKKMISLLCAVVLLISSCLVVTAEEVAENDYLFEDRFIEEYVDESILFGHEYEEKYYHHNENGDIDWCLINAEASDGVLTAAIYLKIDDFILSSGSIYFPFPFRYVIYDVENDKFVDLIDNYDKLADYDGLIDVLRSLKNSRVIGDGDRDGVLSIIDANIIQSALAGKIDLNISKHTDWRTRKRSNYYDVDEDGEFSVMDATAIQLKLAKK